MHKCIPFLLEIQETDMKLLTLIRIKKERLKKIKEIDAITHELDHEIAEKKSNIQELQKNVNQAELALEEVAQKHKHLSDQQPHIKKVEEFNALTQEMNALEKAKIAAEKMASEIIDQKNIEEEFLHQLEEKRQEAQRKKEQLQQENTEYLQEIYAEGKILKENRKGMIDNIPEGDLYVYEQLLRHKKDRVVVSIENNSCSGCHITLTLQHENLVRKGDSLKFCEHCSRIHYCPEQKISHTSNDRRRKTRGRKPRIAQ